MGGRGIFFGLFWGLLPLVKYITQQRHTVCVYECFWLKIIKKVVAGIFALVARLYVQNKPHICITAVR